MTNHPNRGWRKRAEQAADQWLDTDEGRVLVEVPLAPDPEARRKRVRAAYLAGYRDGRRKPEGPR